MKCQTEDCYNDAEYEKEIYQDGLILIIYVCETHFRRFYDYRDQDEEINKAKLAPKVLI